MVTEYGDFECFELQAGGPGSQTTSAPFQRSRTICLSPFSAGGSPSPCRTRGGSGGNARAGKAKFWPMHDLLFENQPRLKLSQLRSYAERLALDLQRYAAEMEDKVYLQRIREHMQSGRESGVRATPTFFVNRRIQDVSFGMGSLFDAVELALRG
jgi:hypothetical protein